MRLKLTSLPQGRQVVERFKKVDPRGGCGGGGRMEEKKTVSDECNITVL